MSKDSIKKSFAEKLEEYNIKSEYSMDIDDYAEAKEQIEDMQVITFGAQINVLIITDRLYGCAMGLQEYMKNSTDITVDFSNNLEVARQIINQKPVDVLIIAGYLKKKSLYDSVEAVRQLDKYASVIMYASLDDLIEHECSVHKITETYDRNEPIDGLINYMRQRYSEKNANFQEDYPEGATREQLREAAIRDEEDAARSRGEAHIRERKKEQRRKVLIRIGEIAGIILLIVAVIIFLYLFQKHGLMPLK